MIQPLRKWHRRIFYALLFLLPIIFATGLVARHHSVTDKHSTR
jgi:hypothetical protein